MLANLQICWLNHCSLDPHVLLPIRRLVELPAPCTWRPSAIPLYLLSPAITLIHLHCAAAPMPPPLCRPRQLPASRPCLQPASRLCMLASRGGFCPSYLTPSLPCLILQSMSVSLSQSSASSHFVVGDNCCCEVALMCGSDSIKILGLKIEESPTHLSSTLASPIAFLK